MIHSLLREHSASDPRGVAEQEGQFEVITKIGIENFKSVSRKQVLALAPTTVFAGANSSGKTTVLQSLLLTAQTIQNMVSTRPVILNGHVLRLGVFEDILNKLAGSRHQSDTVSIEIELTVTEHLKRFLVRNSGAGSYRASEIDLVSTIGTSYTFGADPGTDPESDASQLQPVLLASSLQAHYQNGSRPARAEINVRRSNHNPDSRVADLGLVTKTITPAEAQSLTYEPTLSPTNLPLGAYPFYETSMAAIGIPVGTHLTHFLPSRLSLLYDRVEETKANYIQLFALQGPHLYYQLHRLTGFEIPEQIREALARTVAEFTKSKKKNLTAANSKKWETFEKHFADESSDGLVQQWNALPKVIQRPLADLFLSFVEQSSKSSKAELRQLAIKTVNLPAVLEIAREAIATYFQNYIRYLGPLRDEPRALYPISGAIDQKELGYRGEYTAAVLDFNKATMVNYIRPLSFANLSDGILPGVEDVRSTNLLEATQVWLDYLGVATSVLTQDRGKLGHELKVLSGDDSEPRDLTHVGVGVSQVLPILVASLLAPQGATLIFEQPELHLHPLVQTRLADFFASLRAVDKQCIIETHSEYIINRFRQHAVASDTASEEVAVYFVQYVPHQGSEFSRLEIDEYGVIENWPEGFFDESEHMAESILRLGSRKRRVRRNG